MIVYARVLFDFDGTQVDDGLSCQVDDKVKILEEYDDWYWVRLGDQEGFVPANYVEKMVQNQTLPLPKEKEAVKEPSSDAQKADPEPISSYGTARTYEFKRNPDLDEALRRKEAMASQEVNMDIDQNTLRSAGDLTIHSTDSDGSHKYAFQRDPELDRLLRKKAEFCSREASPEEKKEFAQLGEKKTFEFKRDPELDRLLKRKAKIATKEVSLDIDADTLRNIQQSTVDPHPALRTKEQIEREVEEVKKDFYYEPPAAPKKPASPTLPPSRPSRSNRPSMVYEEVTEPVLKVKPLPKSAFTFMKRQPGAPSPKLPASPASPVSPDVPASPASPELPLSPASPELPTSPASPELPTSPSSQASTPTASAAPDAQTPEVPEGEKESAALGLGRETMCEIDALIGDLDIDTMLDGLDATGAVDPLEPIGEDTGTLGREERFAIALYPFEARGETEISVEENESLVVLEEVDEWVRVRKMNCETGFVPLSYISYVD